MAEEPTRETAPEFLWEYEARRQHFEVLGRVFLCDLCGAQNQECVSEFLAQNDHVCRRCRWSDRSRFGKIPQTRVAAEYGLSVADLKEALRPTAAHPRGRLTVEIKANRKEHLRDVILYYRFQLERLCVAKHGSLAAWQQQREQRSRTKYHTLLARLAEPREDAPPAHRVRRLQQGGNGAGSCHHEFAETDVVDDPEALVTKHSRVCLRCNHRETWEELKDD